MDGERTRCIAGASGEMLVLEAALGFAPDLRHEPDDTESEWGRGHRTAHDRRRP
jgi:hypothetical protein